MKTSEVLNKAADLIEQRGWAQGILSSPYYSNDPWGLDGEDAPVCLEGGIIAAMELRGQGVPFGSQRDVRTCDAYRAVRTYLQDFFDTTNTPDAIVIFPYNDVPGRTPEEVIATLRATALIEASREEAAEKAEQPCAAGV